MKTIKSIFIVLLVHTMIQFTSFGQDSITDYDGNIYHTIAIGNQVWLKENLKSLHYSDGTVIPGAVSYNNADSLAAIYGRLYNWNAAMYNSTTAGAQGACPDNWHIPTHPEWTVMDEFLGGSSVAGGKLKETGYIHWLAPNTGATNSSGFTGLPGGEYDGNQSKTFKFLRTAAVFWTSTQAGSVMATERYLSHDDELSGTLNWYKTMKYSLRCIKDPGTGIQINQRDKKQIIRISNPFQNTFTIRGGDFHPVRVVIYTILGQLLKEMNLNDGSSDVILDFSWLPKGIYIIEVNATENIMHQNSLSGHQLKFVFKCIKNE